MKNWTNQKIKYREYDKQYVDIDTGELITEKRYKQQYGHIKTINTKKYGKEKCITTSTKLGRYLGQQEIWEERYIEKRDGEQGTEK